MERTPRLARAFLLASLFTTVGAGCELPPRAVSLPGNRANTSRVREVNASPNPVAAVGTAEPTNPGPVSEHPLLAGASNPFVSEAAPENRLLYLDTSRSALDGVLLAWDSVAAETEWFLSHAAPGSRFEIYRTDRAAGHPVLLFAATVPRARPVDRRAYVAESVGKIALLRNELIANLPWAHGSFLIEDLRRLGDRAGSLPGPSALLAISDFEQWSPFLHDKEILAAEMKSPPSPESDSETTAVTTLLANLGKKLPPLRRPPAAVYLLYVAPRSEQGPLQGNEGELRTRFFHDLLAAWGTSPGQVSIEEPHLMSPTDLQPADGESIPAQAQTRRDASSLPPPVPEAGTIPLPELLSLEAR